MWQSAVQNGSVDLSKVKVQASIHEDKVRISGKSRDDLQAIMKLVRDKDFGIALSFDNRRTI